MAHLWAFTPQKCCKHTTFKQQFQGSSWLSTTFPGDRVGHDPSGQHVPPSLRHHQPRHVGAPSSQKLIRHLVCRGAQPGWGGPARIFYSHWESCSRAPGSSTGSAHVLTGSVAGWAVRAGILKRTPGGDPGADPGQVTSISHAYAPWP